MQDMKLKLMLNVQPLRTVGITINKAFFEAVKEDESFIFSDGTSGQKKQTNSVALTGLASMLGVNLVTIKRCLVIRGKAI